MKKYVAFSMVVVLAVIAIVAMSSGSPVEIMAWMYYSHTIGEGNTIQLTVTNNSHVPMLVNHVTVVTGVDTYVTTRSVKITNGSLFISVPVEWPSGADATVFVGYSYGTGSYVEQVTRF